jgi:YidC/Oxa1 family membrane protein insertase
LETKRLVLAFALSAAVLIGWTLIFPPPKPVTPPVPTPTVLSEAAPAASTGTATAAPASAAAAPVAQAPTVRVPPVAAAAEEDVTIDTALYVARLSNRGGDLRSFVLKRFKDGAGRPLDLVPAKPPFPGRTLTLDPADPFLVRAAAALYTVDRSEAGGKTTLRFHYREADGSGILREYVFGNEYRVSLKVEREGGAKAPVAVVLGPGIGNPSAEELTNRYTKPGSTILLLASGSVDRHAKDGLKEVIAVGKGAVAAGLEDNYFLAAFLPPASVSVSLRPVALPLPAAADGKAAADAESEVVLAGPGTVETEVFLGPKELDLLERTRPGMNRLIDYGWFAILVQPLLYVLKAIFKFVGNWGVAIILITVLIKVVLYPLTHKQLVSMKKMSKLQPKMETIRAKWSTKLKTDPQARAKMNEETMALYKQEGVNPAGGCLPLVLQMPILIAFYNLLAHSIELRHAPFMLWITDLSAKDPYYVTPILMTATMWLQQQMTPPQGDPAMRKVMNIMPFMMGFLFKDVPSGLVLYWLMQNVLTILQQYILNRYTDLGTGSMQKASSKPA